MKKVSIAIDGPSGAGKSTLARMVAKHFGYIYVDTGAIYRSVGLFVLRKGKNTASAADVTPLLPEIHLELLYENGVQKMMLNGEDVSEAIRMPEVSLAASNVSAIPQVRAFLLDMQRDMAKTHSVVMDGRDIGTVVLPQADLKIFLTATAEERAHRRYKELLDKKVETTYAAVLEDLKLRDKNDSTRASAPLKAAEDAVLLNTTGYTLEESFEMIKGLVEGMVKNEP